MPMERSVRLRLNGLYLRFCTLDRSMCPICSTKLIQKAGKNSRTGYFFACPGFPTCRGARFQDGTAVMNEFTINWLEQSKREFDQSLVPKPIRKGRFVDIE